MLPQLFNYEGLELRMASVTDQPWFVAQDVCNILQLGNPSLAVNGNPSREGDTGLDDDEKGLYIVNTLGGPQKLLCINESGLYSMTFKSRKTEAKAFKRWVTHVVIPSIRKTGSYSTKQQPTPNEPQRLRAEAMLLNAKTRQAKVMKETASMFQDKLSDASIHLLIGGITEILMGKSLLPLPIIEKTYSATEIGEELGVSSNRIGKLANRNNLKTDEYGITVLDKSPYSTKQVPSFRYNEQGKEKLRELCQ